MVRWPQSGSRHVKRVVVDIAHRLLSLDVVFRAGIPHRRLRPTDQDQNKPWVMVVLARHSPARSCLRCSAEQSITGMPCALA